MKRQNCWEYMGCGRGINGPHAKTRGVCPAAIDDSYDGINSGHCGGRFCWAVAGTLCGGEIQGTFAEKRENCTTCDFYLKVQAEEGTANLRNTFLRFMGSKSAHHLFHPRNTRHIPKGERFVIQGESGDEAYVLQRGACIEIVEKNGFLHPVSHRGAGDIVGMISLLTGDPRPTHIEAETDVDVWVIPQKDLNDLFQTDADLLNFLTELVAQRFDSKRPIAERTISRKYIATEIMDRGGCSLVYRAYHKDLNLPVAIKMMRHNLVCRSEFLETFRNEAKLIASLNHENIIRVLDIEERFRTIFIIMEFLEGESLKQLLERLKVLPPELTGHLMFQVCSALAYAHGKGIIHRDINPGNVFVLRGDKVKLIDFGLAFRKGNDEHLLDGTLAYQAPELLDGEAANEASDMYALGVSAYELVTGHLPHPVDNVAKFMKSRRKEEIPDPALEVPDIPADLRRFILTACHGDPSRRYAGAGEALADLRTFEFPLHNRHANSTTSDQNRISMVMKYPVIREKELMRLFQEFAMAAEKLDVEITPLFPFGGTKTRSRND